ncbi:acetolactate synthase catalytic subunit [Klebsiella pneumoniae]|nr:acetolactate synthase catalytic subunit [Klebsiella pneumoniae]
MASITLSAAELLLHRLQALDVAYIFINSGTDYPPVIEAWAKARATGQKVPELVICPHENAAIGMAHGYYLGTGKVQAVMVHTNVGLANARLRRHQSGEQQYSGADFWRPHADKRTFPLRLP